MLRKIKVTSNTGIGVDAEIVDMNSGNVIRDILIRSLQFGAEGNSCDVWLIAGDQSPTRVPVRLTSIVCEFEVGTPDKKPVSA